VLEAADTIGGGARSAELTLPGFVHDVCSGIHPMGALSPFWRELPLARFGLEWIEPEIALAHPLEDGGAAAVHRSLARTIEALGSDGRAYGELLGPFLERAQPFFDEILRPIRVPGHPLLLARFGGVALRSSDAVAARFRGERARALFAGCAAHSILPLHRPGSAAFALALLLAAHRVSWPCARGGSGRIVDALAAHLRELGGEIVPGRPVRALADVPPARAVLFDLTPRQVVGIAGDALPANYRRRLDAYRYGPGACKVDWALDGPIPWTSEACRRAGTVHVGGTYEAIAAGEAEPWKGRHAERPFVLVGQQSLFDPGRAPAGRHTGWAYTHVPHGSARDMTDVIERQIERFAPGFRDRILARHTRTAAELERYNANLVGGDIGGGANTLGQVLARPVASWDPYATPNPRLYLCSSSTPPGGGVHGMCGFNAARSALRRTFARA
jgi:phytoene dehydrogenase-like protein